VVVDLHIVFVACPFGQGERIEVRGSSLAEAKRAENKPSPSPSPFRREKHPGASGVSNSIESPT
jgi:hypothetical protein